MPDTDDEHGPDHGSEPEVLLLGPVEVRDAGRPLALRQGRERLLVAALALDAGRTVGTGRLIETLWPDELPADPANALQHQVAQVRKALGPARDRLRTDSGGYALELSRSSVDALAFEDDLAAARAALAEADFTRAVRVAAQALGRFRGEPLADAPEGPLREDAARLAGEGIAAEIVRADGLLGLGLAEEAADRLEALTGREPLSEPLWTRRLAALAQAGRSAEALTAYEQARRELGAALGAEPGPELRALHMRILGSEAAEAGGRPGSRPEAEGQGGRLPAPITSFHGREDELAELVAMLEDRPRLATLVGTGGIGKTRLAVEAVRRAAGAFTAGADFVRLGSVDDRDGVIGAICRAVELIEDPQRPLLETLADHLSGPRLLVLDNCEGVVAAAATVASELLSRCEELSILATSRERLGLAGEVVMRIEPLALPESDEVDGGGGGAAALELFRERAAAASPHLSWSAEERTAAVEIVRTLDGLPLAIELAAARVGTVSPVQLAEHLGDRFELLDDALRDPAHHHRGLRATVEWSHGTLAPPARELFDRLSVVAGPIDQAVAAALAGADDPVEVLPLLSDLADRSLLEPLMGTGSIPQYRMLLTLRAYGRERLRNDDAEQPALDAHLRHYAAFAEDGDAGLKGSDQIGWLRRLDDARGDLRSATLHAAAAGDTPTGLRLLAALGRYLDWRGHLHAADDWSARLLEAPGASGAARLGAVRAWRAFVLSEFGARADAARQGERALKEAQAAGDLEGEMIARAGRAVAARSEGHHAEAIEKSSAALDVAEAADDRWAIGWSRNARGYALAADGSLEEAAREARESAKIFQSLGDERGVGWCMLLHGLVSARSGRFAEAQSCAERSAETARATLDRRTESAALELLAAVGQQAGRGSVGDLLATADRYRRDRGQAKPPYRDADFSPGSGLDP